MSSNLILPKHYRPLQNLHETERAIRKIKEFFQVNLSLELNLTRVTAPMFVLSGTGINDNLNGVERPVSFDIKSMDDAQAEIVHSLAKWKRLMLSDYQFRHGQGLYTDMNAIRADEDLDNLHSLYVDQWDWELVISEKEKQLVFLKKIVEKIYDVIRRTELFIAQEYASIQPILPEEITFIHSEDLEQEFPDLSPSERETEACKKYGAVFVIGIGGELTDGKPHDGRAPDYDDWSTPTVDHRKGLNGDILVYYPLFERSYELSSMGIRVDSSSLARQLELTNAMDRKDLYFHKRLLSGDLPLSIGGGIGQSRLCMFYLRKAHIGEIQASIWPAEMIEKCRENNITLL
jgi:aspartate--ammonia ligase